MDNIKTVRDFLSEYEKMAGKMEKELSGITGILQFDFTEDDNGYWYIEFVDGKVKPLMEDRAVNPTMTISGAYEVFYGLKTGKLKAEEVLPTGKLKLGGDTGFTMKLRSAGLV
ncbi:MAG: SCP2 sterol-binding domain-containing protein [Clostridiales bacterium]|nr:SCP2 sterol-binding domain-containing protein [Clostridiales bacterium]